MGFLRNLGSAGSGAARIRIGRGKARSGWAPFAARLVALRVPQDKVEAAQAGIGKENRRKGRQVRPETLEAATHVLLLTSLDRQDDPVARIGGLHRLRWQVELAFKRLTGLLNIDTLRARDRSLARAWTDTNLRAAFLPDDMIRPRRTPPLRRLTGRATQLPGTSPSGASSRRRSTACRLQSSARSRSIPPAQGSRSSLIASANLEDEESHKWFNT